MAGDQEGGPRGFEASILAQPSTVCLLVMHSALPHSALPAVGHHTCHLLSNLLNPRSLGQQVGGQEYPSAMLTILMKSFLNIQRPEYLLGEGNIIILIILVTTY